MTDRDKIAGQIEILFDRLGIKVGADEESYGLLSYPIADWILENKPFVYNDSVTCCASAYKFALEDWIKNMTGEKQCVK